MFKLKTGIFRISHEIMGLSMTESGTGIVFLLKGGPLKPVQAFLNLLQESLNNS
jgi:hypothetical protein